MEKDAYKSHFQSPEFGKAFLDFKRCILDAEMGFSRESAAIVGSNSRHSEMSVLELGAGEGSVSLGFLQKLAKTKMIKKYTAIDIAPDLIPLLEEKRNDFERCAQNVSFECFDVAKYRFQANYELVIALNSLYGMDFDVIPKLLSYLRDKGIIAILLNSKDSLTLDLTRKFTEPMVSAEDLMSWLERKNIPYKAYDMRSKRLSKKDFILENKLNPSAEPVYRYLLRRIHGPLEDIFAYLSKKPDKYFQIPQKLIVIPK